MSRTLATLRTLPRKRALPPPRRKPRPASEASARNAAHRKAVLDVLGTRPADLSYSPAEIARMAGVPADEIDALVSAMHAEGSLEEMSDEPDEDPTYRAKPKATIVTGERVVAVLPGGDRKRVNRKGKPAPTVAGELARTCRVCSCTAEKPCRDDAERPCCWTSAETPATGDVCTVCAELLDTARDALARGIPAAELAEELHKDAPPCVSSARAGKVIEIVIAATSKKDRPRDTSKKRGTVTAPPAQASLPGSEVARTATLPFPREPLAALPDERGTCSRCGEVLTRDNSSRLQSSAVVHIGCAAAPSSEGPIELSCPCAACDANRGEACAWATPEPASYVHPVRIRLVSPEYHAGIERRAIEDRIRALCDYFAGLASVHPMPTEAAILRACEGRAAATAADVFGAMCERGELVPHGDVADSYYRRAPGSAPVVMGRVGVKVPSMLDVAKAHAEEVLSLPAGATAPDPTDVAETHGAHLGYCSPDEPCGNCAALDEGPVRDAAVARIGDYAAPDATPDLLGRPRDPNGAGMGDDAEEREADEPSDDGKGCNLCGGEPDYVACMRCGRPGTLPLDDEGPAILTEMPSEPADDAGPPLAFPVEAALVDVQEAAQALARLRGHLGTLLGADVRERAAVAQLDAVQRERDEACAEVERVTREFDLAVRDIETAARQRDEARAERDAATAAATHANGPRFRQALLDLYTLAGGEQNPGSATSREIVDVVCATVRARLRSDADGDAARERDEALVQRDAAETAIRDLADAFGVDVGASPAETCVAVARLAKSATDGLALAKDLARLAQLEAADRTEEKRTLRGALATLYERCGGTNVPAKDDDLIAATANRVDDTIRDASNERAHLLASRVLTLRAGIVAALPEAPADPSALDDAALVALLSERPSLDSVVATAVLQLSGEAPPMGRGIAPLAAALGEAVRVVLAERAEASRRAVAVAAVTAHAAPADTPAPTPPVRRARTADIDFE